MKNNEIHIKSKLEILSQASKNQLEYTIANRQSEPNFKKIYDENIAKKNLYSYLLNDEFNPSKRSFYETLDYLEKNPQFANEEIYDKKQYEKYWNSYVSLLKISDFDEF